jgi:hypothetical protein
MKYAVVMFLLPVLLFSFNLYPPDTTLIQIKTKEMANHGTPFYVLIKPCSFTQFLKDDYYKIVEEKLSDDSQFLSVSCLMPGDTKLLEVKTPEKEALAVYCIFTKPGDEWKYFIDAEGPRKIKILIGNSEIEATSRF